MDSSVRRQISEARSQGIVWLDAGRADAGQMSLLFVDPVHILRATTAGDIPAVLAAIDAAVEDGLYVAGYLGYEAGYGFTGLPEAPHAQQPLAWFGLYEAPQVIPPATGGEEVATCSVDEVHFIDDMRFGLDEGHYRKQIDQIRRHIRAGDVYQVNFTDRIEFSFESDPLALYGTLRSRQTTPYGAYIDTGERQILSRSPELFFRREGSHILTRPMKGTARRGETPAEDDRRARALASDPKNRAENLMIVDLLRNDLSRVCRAGSVGVRQLFETERYETLIQMCSTIEGTLREDTSYSDLFPALFPCGSVTGAPKRRAMELIGHLERRPRDVYCGAIGYAGPDGRATFSVAIRTIVLEQARGWMGAGSGVVWDSDAGAEYEECLLKTDFLTA